MDQTIGALFRAKAISEDEVDAAVTSCVAGPPDEAFVFAGTYLVNLAAAVQALPQARERLSDPAASEFLKRIAVRTAIMLARPDKQGPDPVINYSGEDAPLSGGAEPAEYDIRQEEVGWGVYHAKTGTPVRLNEVPQIGLSRRVAEEILQTLDMVEPGPDKDAEG
ncbi:hypothetical protein [Methylobacterium nigriterrae]|uniref:hypothetical protein n=1 Tax=Methylobacterium nigriterrae TaxID=3127512 RepID=UPI00301393B6